MRISQRIEIVWQELWGWVTYPSMNRVIVLGLLVTGGLFALTLEHYREVSVIPLAWLISFGMVGLLYIVDRWGFSQIDTIELLFDDPDMYRFWFGVYASLIVFAHLAAYFVIGA